MDSNLKEPLEMKILFDALSSTVPKDYLDIEKVRTDYMHVQS